MREEIEYLVTALDFHIRTGRSPHAAWIEAVKDYAFVYYPPDDEEGGLRLPISRAAERALYHNAPLSEPIRKFMNHEPLAAEQHVIVAAVKALVSGNNRLAAIKLIRGTFLDKDELCPLTVAKTILDSIIIAS